MSKKTYIAKVKMVVYLHTEIEADTEHEAFELASEMDGGDFHEDDASWDVYEVEEVNPK